VSCVSSSSLLILVYPNRHIGAGLGFGPAGTEFMQRMTHIQPTVHERGGDVQGPILFAKDSPLTHEATLPRRRICCIVRGPVAMLRRMK
jgi:hypothetical protein